MASKSANTSDTVHPASLLPNDLDESGKMKVEEHWVIIRTQAIILQREVPSDKIVGPRILKWIEILPHQHFGWKLARLGPEHFLVVSSVLSWEKVDTLPKPGRVF